MCVKFTLTESKDSLQELFQDDLPWSWQANTNSLPYNAYPILTKDGIQSMCWGDISTKEIHKRKSDITSNHLLHGILPINGFYTWKKEKLIAPIGFGDHKETIKLHPILIKHENQSVTFVPVLFQVIKEQMVFYILVDEASKRIKQYQPNEPLVIENYSDWVNLKNVKLMKFSDSPIVLIPQ